MTPTPVVSIIVPVYNAEKFLHRCIDSILAQTFSDWELLLVDDGSKDASGSICDEYATKDNRIKVFHKENGGVSSARNLGLDHSRGSWISFVDSDDLLPVQALQFQLPNEDVDLVVSGYALENDSDTPILPNFVGINMHENLRDFILANYLNSFLAAPWAKLYKRSIILTNNIRFDENLKLCEDAIFVSNYLLYIKSIKSIKDVCYIYNVPSDMGEKYTPLFIDDIDKIFYLYDTIREVYDKLNRCLNVTSIKSDCSIVYGLLENAIIRNKFNKQNVERFCFFLRDAYVIEALKKKKQKYINGLLLVSKIRIPCLVYAYMKFMLLLYHSLINR